MPFYLRTGKRLAQRSTEIVIQFRRPPLMLFPKNAFDQIEANRLVMCIQPCESITFEVKAKRPGPTVRLTTVSLHFDYDDFGGRIPATGYERLLYDAMIGDSTQFHRSDMVDASWRIATPILDAWDSLSPRDFPNYGAGSWGPTSADRMMERDGHHWLNPASTEDRDAVASR